MTGRRPNPSGNGSACVPITMETPLICSLLAAYIDDHRDMTKKRDPIDDLVDALVWMRRSSEADPSTVPGCGEHLLHHEELATAFGEPYRGPPAEPSAEEDSSIDLRVAKISS
jgi:hypothetical protein